MNKSLAFKTLVLILITFPIGATDLGVLQSERCDFLLEKNAWKTVRDKVLLATPYIKGEPSEREKENEEAIYQEIATYICDNSHEENEICQKGRVTASSSEQIKNFVANHSAVKIRPSDIHTERMLDTNGDDKICTEWVISSESFEVRNDKDDFTRREDASSIAVKADMEYNQSISDELVSTAKIEEAMQSSLDGNEMKDDIFLEGQSRLANVDRRYDVRNDDFISSFTKEKKQCTKWEVWERKVVRISNVQNIPFALACSYAIEAKDIHEARLESMINGLHKAFTHVRESFLLSSIVNIGGKGANIEYSAVPFVELAQFLNQSRELEDHSQTINQIRAVPLVELAAEKVSQRLRNLPGLIQEYETLYGRSADQKFRKMAAEVAALIDPLKDEGLYISKGKSNRKDEIEFASKEDVRFFAESFVYVGSPINDQYKFLKSSDFMRFSEVMKEMKKFVEIHARRGQDGTWSDVLEDLKDHVDDPMEFSLMATPGFSKGLELWAELNSRSAQVSTEEYPYTLEGAVAASGQISKHRWQEIVDDVYEDMIDRMWAEKIIPISIRPNLRRRDGRLTIFFVFKGLRAPEYKVSLHK